MLRANQFHETEWAIDKRLRAATGDQVEHPRQPKQVIHKSSMAVSLLGPTLVSVQVSGTGIGVM